jgi:hypothetical protein
MFRHSVQTQTNGSTAIFKMLIVGKYDCWWQWLVAMAGGNGWRQWLVRCAITCTLCQLILESSLLHVCTVPRLCNKGFHAMHARLWSGGTYAQVGAQHAVAQHGDQHGEIEAVQA